MIKFIRCFIWDGFVLIKSTTGRIMRQAGLELDRKGSMLQNDIAYLEPLNRHRNIMALYGQIPEISPSAHIASNATVFGNVFVGANSYFGFGSVAKGDANAIRVGTNSKIGENTVLETNYWGNDEAYPLSVNIGNDVTIEHGCQLMSCIVDDNAHIGFRTVVMEGVQIQRGYIIGQRRAVIAPNSYVPAGSRIPAYTLWGGSPVKFIRSIEQEGKNKIDEQVKQQIRITESQS